MYKLISGCIAERIKPVLPNIIHPDQKGFVAGRYIGEVIRTTYDVMHFAKENNLAGLLLTVDFEKAYDSISFNFIIKCLNFYNFSKDIIRWVQILLTDFSAVINHCGNISAPLHVGRGCRQGDPIASYLFILCLEILAHKLRSDERITGFRVQCRGSDIVTIIRHLLEIYADDLTIFIEPTEINLKTVIQTLNQFFLVSGLKISASKTRAVWFGSKHDSVEVLCPELGLQWGKKFSLLGIEFDNNLQELEKNYDTKINNIEKLFKNWSLRYLSPFGKITVVKSLGLSKLSHIALVVPNPSVGLIRRIEGLFFNFIWSGKSEKVRREDAKLPLSQGGLSAPDIHKFWLAFKFSWFRRILTTDAFWPQLLLENVAKILQEDVSVSQLLQFATDKLKQIAQKITNPFWKQVLLSATPIIEGALFSFPGKLMHSSLFFNPHVTRSRTVKYSEFPELVSLGSSLSNFLYPFTNKLMSWEDFRLRYNNNISLEKYIDVRYTIKRSLDKLGISLEKLSFVQYPERPLLIDIAMSTKKGCNRYYKYLTQKNICLNKIFLREAKWQRELNKNFSLKFWHKARLFYAKIDFDNDLKWLQFQIVRNSLQTNSIVHHFRPNVLPSCSFCRNQSSTETISHLFWSCNLVSEFLDETYTHLNDIGLNFRPTMLQFLFGIEDEPYYRPFNYIMLIIKKYIWTTKFGTATLSLVGFRSYLKSCVSNLIVILNIKPMPENVVEWEQIANSL